MKTQFKNKRAFTLIELLIVIAIIGILFIVLVSKVDFATDKSKATGVQTDFRSFQVAIDTVAKENAGLNTFGYNTGDNAGAIPDGYAFETTALKDATIGDGIRNSYDQGDKNLNGKQDTGEVFTGRKIYTENWTEVYTLVKPGTTGLDTNVVFALESAINANLDPKLHITINAADGKITMANQARDPWKNEYHGVYISQAERDNGADRGAIIMYSNGANGKWGSAHDITNGVVTVTVPGNNVNGKDDYSLAVFYTNANGYGETAAITTGFSNNQTFLATNSGLANGNKTYSMITGSNTVVYGASAITFASNADFSTFDYVEVDGIKLNDTQYTVSSGSTVVVLKDEYMATLNYGSHTIKIVSTDGIASCKFYVYDENELYTIYVGARTLTARPGSTLYDVITDNPSDDWNWCSEFIVSNMDAYMVIYDYDTEQIVNLKETRIENEKSYEFAVLLLTSEFAGKGGSFISEQYKSGEAQLITLDGSMMMLSEYGAAFYRLPMFVHKDATYIDVLQAFTDTDNLEPELLKNRVAIFDFDNPLTRYLSLLDGTGRYIDLNTKVKANEMLTVGVYYESGIIDDAEMLERTITNISSMEYPGGIQYGQKYIADGFEMNEYIIFNSNTVDINGITIPCENFGRYVKLITYEEEVVAVIASSLDGTHVFVYNEEGVTIFTLFND